MDFQSRDEEICKTALRCGCPESLRSTIFPLAAKPCVAGSTCACRSYCAKLKALRSRAHNGSAGSKQRMRRSFEFRVSSFAVQSLFVVYGPLCRYPRNSGAMAALIKRFARNLKLET